MSIIIFLDKYLQLCHHYNLPNHIVIILFYKYHHLSGSKMYHHFKLNCSHYTYKMFYRCPNYYLDNHLHCCRCGSYLKNNIKLRKTLHHNLHHITIYPYKRPCQTLTNHLS
jgi:hypothetical protein